MPKFDNTIAESSEVSFFRNYPKSLEKQIIARTQVSGDEPKVLALKNVYFTGCDHTRAFKFGIFDSNGNYIEHGEQKMKGGKIIPDAENWPKMAVKKKANFKSGTYILGGALQDHYGHFTTNFLSRLWYLSHRTGHPLIFHPPPMGYPQDLGNYKIATKEIVVPKYARDFLSLLGVSGKMVHIAVEPTIVENLVVPYSTFQNRCEANMYHKYAFEEAAAKVVQRSKRTDQPVYLSRRRFGQSKRPIQNEIEIEHILKQKGAKIIFPETLSLSEQITLFNEHTIFIGPNGSSFHNILFDLNAQKTTLINLMPISDNKKDNEVTMRASNYCMIDRIKKNRSFYIRCLNEKTVTKYSSTQVYDIGLFKEFVNELL